MALLKSSTALLVQNWVTQSGVGKSPVVVGIGVVGVQRQADCRVEVLDCPGQVAQLGYGPPPVVMRYRVTWVEDDGDVVVQNWDGCAFLTRLRFPSWARASPL